MMLRWNGRMNETVSIMRSNMPAAEQWAVAARMVEVHGIDVGGALLERVQSLMEEGDAQEVQNWLEITEKVQQLVVPEGGA